MKEKPVERPPYVKVFEDDSGVTASFKLFETDHGVQVINAFVQFEMVRTGGMKEEEMRQAFIDFVKKISMDI
jgi:hypothetical protein